MVSVRRSEVYLSWAPDHYMQDIMPVGAPTCLSQVISSIDAGFSKRAEYIGINPVLRIKTIMSNDVKQNLKSQSTWKRGLYMLIYAFCYTIAEILLFAIIFFQFLLKLFSGDTNERLRKLGQGLSTYIYQILQYLNFNSDYQPYPFGAWPKGEPRAAKLDAPSNASEA
jgi:hypothetical protein